jgi:hypothetical protein
VRTCLVFAVIAASTCGCGSDAEPGRLLVDLVTDYAPGRHFATVRTEVSEMSASPGTTAFRTVERAAEAGEPFARGIRVAELDAPSAEPSLVRVALLAEDGRTVAERTALVRIEGDFGITVLITRDCGTVACGGAGMDLEACQGAQCVPATCLPELPSECGSTGMGISPECETDADCAPEVDCAEASCTAGLCITGADDSACDDTEVCDDRSGCVPAPTCGDGSCDAGESYCECGADCVEGCGSACCTGEDPVEPEEIPLEPPPPNPPPAAPVGPGECVVVCCDGESSITVVADAYACRDAFPFCRPHGRVEVMFFAGFQIYERPPWRRCLYCCALCQKRRRFHRVPGVSRRCWAAARDWCSEGTRGGYEDSDWRDCDP